MNDYGLGGWDSPAEIQKLHAYLNAPEQTLHEAVEERRRECLLALSRDAGKTFVDREMMQQPETHPAFQHLVDHLTRPRVDYVEAGRAAEVWLRAEIEFWAENRTEVLI